MVRRTKEELDALGVMDPEYVKAVASDPLPELKGPADFFAMRAHRANLLKERRHLYPVPGPLPEVKEELIHIPMRDGERIQAKTYVPREQPHTGGGALIVMFHEGGWCMGDLTDEDQNCRMFSRDLKAACVNVDYRLGPEHKFPKGIEDCWDALKWCAANATSLGADPAKGFLVGGASAGGNLTAIMAHMARDEGLSPPLTGQYLCCAAICPPPAKMPAEYADQHFSIQDNTHDPVINLKIIDVVTPCYDPDLTSHLWAPLIWPGGHQGLPRAYLQVCGMDPLRDEGLIYEHVLSEEAGVQTKLDLYPGFGHMFWTNFPKMERSTQFVKDTLEGFKWLLGEA